MVQGGQLNIHSYKNRHSRQVRSVALFGRHELQADLVMAPAGETLAWQTDAEHDTLFDVVEGRGTFDIDGYAFIGEPGKCVFVPAGTRYRLAADADGAWVLRVTRVEKVTPRHFMKLLKRSLWDKLGLTS